MRACCEHDDELLLLLLRLVFIAFNPAPLGVGFDVSSAPLNDATHSAWFACRTWKFFDLCNSFAELSAVWCADNVRLSHLLTNVLKSTVDSSFNCQFCILWIITLFGSAVLCPCRPSDLLVLNASAHFVPLHSALPSACSPALTPNQSGLIALSPTASIFDFVSQHALLWLPLWYMERPIDLRIGSRNIVSFLSDNICDLSLSRYLKWICLFMVCSMQWPMLLPRWRQLLFDKSLLFLLAPLPSQLLQVGPNRSLVIYWKKETA